VTTYQQEIVDSCGPQSSGKDENI